MTTRKKYDRLKAIYACDANIAKQRLWSDLLALKPVPPLVNVYFYQYVWEKEFDDGCDDYDSPLHRYIDKQISYKLWKWENLPDDVPIELNVRVPADLLECGQRVNGYQNELWGIGIDLEKSDAAGSYRVKPPIKSEQDIDRINPVGFQVPEQTDSLKEAVAAILGPEAPVRIETNRMHWGPFEYVVWLRGMDRLLFDVIDNPPLVHRLMGIVTDSLINYQRQRQACGFVDSELSFFGHVPYDAFCLQGERDRLESCWAYLHAQSSGSISPDMYAEFVQPYNEKIAAMVGRVYYHGCENLDRKCEIIRNLPNLRLFHISPWSQVEPIVARLGDGFAYEIHSHPTHVLNAYTDEQMRRELRTRAEQAEGFNQVQVLADVETAAGKLDRIQKWIDCVRTLTHRMLVTSH